MNNILLYFSSSLIFLAFLFYFIVSFFNKKELSDESGADMTSEILEDYNGINIVLSKGDFTYYDLKRKVIKLNKNCYYGKSASDTSISLIEAGVFINHRRGNKIINFLSGIIPNLKLLYILPVIAIFINFITYNSFDAMPSLIVLLLFSFIAYIMIDVKTWIYNFYLSKPSINKEIKKFIKMVLYLDWLVLISELIMVFRFLLILLNINF